MPSPTSTPQPAETEFDPLVFWIKHQSKILLLAGLLVVALGGYALSEYIHNKHTAAAEALLANAHSVEDYRKVIADYSGSMPAGDAYLMLAEKLRAEGKLDESSAALHTFIEKYPEHSLISGAWTSLATNLEAQGKLDEALSTYQKVTTTYANSFSAPIALLAQARILAEKGKTEDARRLYEQMLTQFPGNFAAQQAQIELRKLKK
ncbi:Tetratricopeptide TPR_2 repeat protein [Chthoniobacter flavus Ellin428]|uniref:Tetratricopeptide TPR_2 repeat protein n=1 Tax=Chthoniobacter flavus Ellin428 TaxID=497964 RepID=B4D5H9_9BACT|nr:tetratricopeptide repeat protein [Chthoniobacter flavus]EDY18384.1 Tetratricopeptide TPR_2 repeat protein [Chthoniobacter flavus Ellin428]TCO91404.1 tetratricopeptide repeat protein [Chthoniobacter flavus]